MSQLENVAVIGTGMIGTSLGLAIKAGWPQVKVIGHDKELATSRAAAQQGGFDKAEWNLVHACEPADLILLATPLSGIEPTLKAIAPYLKPDVVISDTTHQMEQVLAWADALLPAHAHFVGGHPLVHPSEVPATRYAQASPHLFRGRPYCLTPSKSASGAAVETMMGLVRLLAAEPFFVDAAEHDGLVAGVTQLPHALSVALLHSLLGQSSWRESRKVASVLFEQVSAGAEGDPDSLAASLQANRALSQQLLDRYLHELHTLRQLIAAEDAEPLAQYIDQAVVERRNWMNDYEAGRFVDPELTRQSMPRPTLLQNWFGMSWPSSRR